MLKSTNPFPLHRLRKPGLIVRIVGNKTSHNFQFHDYVIITSHLVRPESLLTNYTYGHCASRPGGQYLSPECIFPIGEIVFPNGNETSADEARILLQAWATSPKRNNTSFCLRPARTQKARGLQALYIKHRKMQPIALIRSQDEIDAGLAIVQFPIMARPCPRKPRHGFVESCIVKTRTSLEKVVQETMAADPHGEVILMAPVKASFSGIVTNTSITLGRRRNGATTGKHCVSIPCHTNVRIALGLHDRIPVLRKNRKITHTQVATYAGIKAADGIFVETVGKEIVQLRTGPEYNSSLTRFSSMPDIRPEFVFTVPFNMDFLAYEKKLTELIACATDPALVLILQPNASLTSHYMVQAISKGCSVATDVNGCEPGQLITFLRSGSMSQFPSASSANYRHAIQKSMELAYSVKPTCDTLAWAVSVIQGIGPTRHNQASVNLVVAAAVILAKAGAGICLGEYRHFFRVGPGRFGAIALAPVSFPHEQKYHYHEGPLDRTQIFEAAFTLPWQKRETWFEMISILSRVESDYHIPDGWAGGYGGTKWGDCTAATVDLVMSLLPYVLTGDEKAEKPLQINTASKQLQCVIQAANRLITVSHNTNKCLTKIIPALTLNDISFGDTGIRIATTPLTWDLVNAHAN